MRPIPKRLVAVVLVGCLVTALAVAGEQECEGLYKGRTPTPEELEAVLRNHQAWEKSAGKRDDARRANLCQANLPKAKLQGARMVLANLQGTRLMGADLQQADLYGAELSGAELQQANLRKAKLRGARMVGAKLQGADLVEADLQGARLHYADLQGANLSLADLRHAHLGVEANLQDADLSMTNLQGAIYEPNPEKLPILYTLLHPHIRLETLVFHRSPAALMALREAFKKGGMRTQERQLTYAIEHTKRLQAWNPSWHDPKEEDTRPWLEQLAGKSESRFSYVWFELPSHYGMAPGRALWGLLGLVPGFAVFYWIVLHNAKSDSGLWMIVPADRIAPGRGKEKIVRIRPHPAKTWRERLRGETRLFCTSLYFSLLSAFHLGWRELNVGTWITRMQPREYTLRATGWVRTVSGIQSLLSVYLLALWVLTYFSRPFE